VSASYTKKQTLAGDNNTTFTNLIYLGIPILIFTNASQMYYSQVCLPVQS